mgnify:CR=1 FL=1
MERGKISVKRYWDVSYNILHGRDESYFYSQLRELVFESVQLHGRSDVPVGSYVSGGMDSSLMFHLSALNSSSSLAGFHGRFLDFSGYDESSFAADAVNHGGGKLHTIDIGASDFTNTIADVIYHLDFPIAGPGSFPQFMVSRLAAEHTKVVLGGQGGDEIFGGYARYMVAYLEQCIKAAIDGTYRNGNYVVTIESITRAGPILRNVRTPNATSSPLLGVSPGAKNFTNFS